MILLIPVVPAYLYRKEAAQVRAFINALKLAKLARAVSAARSVA